jgi:hypothetical protein
VLPLEEDSEAMLAPLDARAKGSAAMISLSDAELTAVLDACKPLCKPLRPGDRDPFLRALAQELGREPQLGPGVIHRVARNLQRQFFDPPDLSGIVSKYN